MKFIIKFLVILTFISITFAEENPLFGPGANHPWGEIIKKMAISHGTRTSAWIDRGVLLTMVPVGDGTYQIRYDLVPGAEYNFIFFAETSSTPPKGLKPNQIYYDAVPSAGTDMAFIVSTSPTNVINIGNVGYINIGGDTRRYIKIPEWLPDGTTVYVYSNWASTPTAPKKFKARPGNKLVRLSWDYPYSYWGESEEGKAIDVIVGGVYHIFRSTNPEGPYTLILTTAGWVTSYTDTSVENGKVYYYTIISSDCYRGRFNLAQGDVNLTTISPREEPPPVPNLAWATPNESIPVRFYIKNIDWEKVIENDYLVYLTHEREEDIFSTSKKIQARITKVYLKKTLFDYYNEFISKINHLFVEQKIAKKEFPPKKIVLIGQKS